MLIPCRCFACGKPVGHLWEQYKERTAKGEAPKKVMDDLGLKRACCRGMFMGQIDFYKTVSKFV